MKPVIVGTAGHIDHGKTALVKALTGIDADRLEEEKRRGITIDIGFAHLELPAPNGERLRLGFIDVPGHERFVRNMLAGTGGIDLVLLVIAADESIKPQTREHFDICRLLSVQRGITVLTKTDLASPEMLEVVRLEVEEFLRGSFLDAGRSPIIPVSARTGTGLEQLKNALAAASMEARAKDPQAISRMPIDRVFTMKGFGTVVTGTVIAGTIGKEEELEVFPTGKRVRVRGIQVHGQPSDQAVAGQRAALNLAGVATDDLSRGMVLAPPETFRSTRRVDALVSLLPSARAMKTGGRVHCHAYTMETIAEVRPYSAKEFKPGEEQFVQLRFADPTLLLPGDRFILRQFSPVVTIGGGMVLDAALPAKVSQPGRPPFLQVLKDGSPSEVLQARIASHADQGLSLAEAVAETGWRSTEIEVHLHVPLKRRSVVRASDCFVHADALDRLKAKLEKGVSEFHKREPLAPGTSKEALRDQLSAAQKVFDIALDMLVQEHKTEITGDLVRLPGRGIVMKDEEAESMKTIETAFASAGLKVPALGEVLASVKVDGVRARKIVTLLLRDKVLVKIADDMVFHQGALVELRKRLAAERSKSPKMDVARFKDLTGVSRKYAIPLLEYLDRERVTRRVGNEREIL